MKNFRQNILSNNSDIMNLERHVIAIQKKYLFKRFIKSIVNSESLINSMYIYTEEYTNYNLFNKSASDNEKFEELRKILTSKENIKKIDDILKKLRRFHKVNNDIAPEISARKFATAWMLVAFPEIILGKKKITINNENNYPDDIYFISKKMIELLKQITKDSNNESKRIFLKSFNQFSNAINYFLNRDRTEKIYNLTREYFDICKTLKMIMKSEKYSNEAKNQCINVINDTKNKIMSYIKSFDSEIKESDLELYANLDDLRSVQIDKIQYKILIDDLKNKKFVFFERLLKEIKLNIIKLSGSSGICSDINDVLDSEFLIRNITYSPLEKNDVEKYGDYLVDIVNKLQAPVRVQETKAKWLSMKKSFDDVNEFLASMLFFVFDEIQDIKETIVNLSAMSSMGINIFST